MKLKPWHSIFITLIVLVLVLLVYMSQNNQAGNKSLHDQMRLSASERVTCVELSVKGKSKMRFTKHDGMWWLNDSIAVDQFAVDGMLNSLKQLHVRGPVAIETRQQVMQELDKSGVHVKLFEQKHWITLPGNIRLFKRNKMLHEIIVGYDIEDGGGTYVSTGRGEYPYTVYMPGTEGGINKFFSISQHAWADPVVVNFQPADIKEVNVQILDNHEESFQLFIDEAQFYFLDYQGNRINNKLINTDKPGRFLSSFRQLRHERKMPPNDKCLPDDALSDIPFLHIVIKNASDSIVEMHFYRRKRPDDGTLVSKLREYDTNRFYVKTNECDYALALYQIFQPIMRPLSYFVNNE